MVSALSRSEPGFDTSDLVPRVDIHPRLALPIHFGRWTLRPTVAVRDTFYGKSQNPAPLGDLPSERDASLNRKDVEVGAELRPPALERDFSAVAGAAAGRRRGPPCDRAGCALPVCEGHWELQLRAALRRHRRGQRHERGGV